ncbi:CvpA family protein [Savagea sp. SN6]|uniref:CvpA family protein n=1 Tax=Savagea serpentis TaxID=2785297 RepID=A0A8J7G799_9BACL|nr:CvpA family protein [Savagea serpentis]MBF4501646.1 CvpA family protein [Savagea serpentis]
MFDILILLLLGIGLALGFHRGLIMQSIRFSALWIAILIAYLLYKKIASYFVLWVPYPNVQAHEKLTWAAKELDLDITFYNALAFVALFFVSYVLLLIVVAMFDYMRYAYVLKFETRFISAAIGFIEMYFILFFIFSVMALLPLDFVQGIVNRSFFMRMMFEHTPLLSRIMQNWWFSYMTN